MSKTSISPRDVLQTLRRSPALFVGPIMATTLLAFVFSFVQKGSWEATQALVVRNEAGDPLSRPGKFTHTDEMKTTQETILELAKNRSVIAKALTEVGPPKDRTVSGEWPSEGDIEGLQGSVKVTPPKGAEFGKTEVFYLKVQSSDRQRALDLAAAICGQLQDRFAQLREAKAQSTTDELTKSVSMAQKDLADATVELSSMEQLVGSDLAELRILNESPSGDSDLRRTSLDLEKDLRTYRAAHSESEEFLKLLHAAQEDPTKLLASPSVLLRSQPALGRLKDGLVDAQIRTGVLLGNMSEEHPLVLSAREAENAIRQQLHDEIKTAIFGVEVDQRINAERIASLEVQHNEIQRRLQKLAGVRAEYANLVAASRNRSETLKSVEHELAEARASRAAAHVGSLINLVDGPDAGTRPAGPGRSAMILGGFGAGLMISLALLFLRISPSTQEESHSPRSLPMQESHRVASSGSFNLKQALRRVAVDWH